jgi:hypothetical protein
VLGLKADDESGLFPDLDCVPIENLVGLLYGGRIVRAVDFGGRRCNVAILLNRINAIVGHGHIMCRTDDRVWSIRLTFEIRTPRSAN